MNSTGNCPPPGRAGGVTGNIDSPLISLSLPATSGLISNTERSRSLQSFSAMPPKPPDGNVSWNVKSVSSISRNTASASADQREAASIVELPLASMMPKMMPWSSVGASSLADIWNIGMQRRVMPIQTT